MKTRLSLYTPRSRTNTPSSGSTTFLPSNRTSEMSAVATVSSSCSCAYFLWLEVCEGSYAGWSPPLTKARSRLAVEMRWYICQVMKSNWAAFVATSSRLSQRSSASGADRIGMGRVGSREEATRIGKEDDGRLYCDKAAHDSSPSQEVVNSMIVGTDGVGIGRVLLFFMVFTRRFIYVVHKYERGKCCSAGSLMLIGIVSVSVSPPCSHLSVVALLAVGPLRFASRADPRLSSPIWRRLHVRT